MVCEFVGRRLSGGRIFGDILGLAGLITLTGCGSGSAVKSPGATAVISQAALSPPTPADLSANQRPYLIGPFDKLTIDTFGIPELSNEVEADASGRISMPLIGSIDAAGKTPEALARTIESQLRGRYIRNPQVTVNLKETVSQVITVDGEVREPGLYPVVGHMTLMRAVATAKGASEFAKLRDVVIFRTVEGKHLAGLYDLGAIRRGIYDDPEVFANDVVIVGNSRARRLFKDFIQLSPLLATPLTLLLR